MMSLTSILSRYECVGFFFENNLNQTGQVSGSTQSSAEEHYSKTRPTTIPNSIRILEQMKAGDI
jgi:hypothetical protein